MGHRLRMGPHALARKTFSHTPGYRFRFAQQSRFPRSHFRSRRRSQFRRAKTRRHHRQNSQSHRRRNRTRFERRTRRHAQRRLRHQFGRGKDSAALKRPPQEGNRARPRRRRRQRRHFHSRQFSRRRSWQSFRRKIRQRTL